MPPPSGISISHAGSSGSEAKTSSFLSSWMAMVAMALGTAARLSRSAVTVSDSPGYMWVRAPLPPCSAWTVPMARTLPSIPPDSEPSRVPTPSRSAR